MGQFSQARADRTKQLQPCSSKVLSLTHVARTDPHTELDTVPESAGPPVLKSERGDLSPFFPPPLGVAPPFRWRGEGGRGYFLPAFLQGFLCRPAKLLGNKGILRAFMCPACIFVGFCGVVTVKPAFFVGFSLDLGAQSCLFCGVCQVRAAKRCIFGPSWCWGKLAGRFSELVLVVAAVLSFIFGAQVEFMWEMAQKLPGCMKNPPTRKLEARWEATAMGCSSDLGGIATLAVEAP